MKKLFFLLMFLLALISCTDDDVANLKSSEEYTTQAIIGKNGEAIYLGSSTN